MEKNTLYCVYVVVMCCVDFRNVTFKNFMGLRCSNMVFKFYNVVLCFENLSFTAHV